MADIFIWDITEPSEWAEKTDLLWVGITSPGVNLDEDHWDKLHRTAVGTASALVYSDSHDTGITFQPFNPCAPHLATLPVPCLIMTEFLVAGIEREDPGAGVEQPGGLWDALCRVAYMQGDRMTYLAECTWKARTYPEERQRDYPQDPYMDQVSSM